LYKTAFLFPGQGSQSVGMGLDFYQEYVAVKELFDMAEETVKLNLKQLCFKGPMEELTRTVHLQPALTTVSLSIWTVLEKEGIKADITAGHSLGEYSALRAACVMSTGDTLSAVMKRGELMHRESLKQPGAMHAVIGLSIDAVSAIVNECQGAGPVSVANHNMALQTVITGATAPVEAASAKAAAQGARVVPLKVSGAWHSALIQGAEAEFKGFLASIPFDPPLCPVVHNVTAGTEKNPSAIKDLLVSQLCSPVRWYDTMQHLMQQSVTDFAEIGPGAVLTGLLKKTLPSDGNARLHRVNSLKTLEAFLKAVT